MTETEFNRIASIVKEHIGIQMPESKKDMIASRLVRRLRELSIDTYWNYCRYLESAAGWASEMVHFSDLVTTHKTSFFREPEQLTVLRNTILPELVKEHPQTPLKLWSAGCSSGEEVYTLRMLLEEFRTDTSNRALEFTLLGTDVSDLVLRKAAQAIYPEASVAEIPEPIRRRYFLRSKDKTRQEARVAPQYRTNTTFKQLNFNHDQWGIQESFHVIFCRNVLIYFDAPSQKRIITQFINRLVPGGYLFLGHAESISQLQLPLKPLQRNIHRKPPDMVGNRVGRSS